MHDCFASLDKPFFGEGEDFYELKWQPFYNRGDLNYVP